MDQSLQSPIAAVVANKDDPLFTRLDHVYRGCGDAETRAVIQAAGLEIANLREKNAKLKKVVHWAYWNGHTPTDMSRTDHSFLANL